ncbi:hypothetical protein NDU88_000555 [Pleurodeles waltl]|uniref:Uncharacterized protein n=1 Tax=Pleurodeles waltl TaxID=8319 RepID=A0AAV7ML69_PLEWA|nr:hypothetical protein NDU88_000555 [Pleurodeles waltl]
MPAPSSHIDQAEPFPPRAYLNSKFSIALRVRKGCRRALACERGPVSHTRVRSNSDGKRSPVARLLRPLKPIGLGARAVEQGLLCGARWDQESVG